MKLWKRPWSLAEGFVLAGGLILVGVMIQLCAGPLDWDLFAWPVNIFVLAAFIVTAIVIFLLHSKIYALRFLTTYAAAVPVLAFAAALTVIMGLTRQYKEGGSWLNDMLAFWPFVLVYSYLALILALVILKRMITITRQRHTKGWLAHLSFLLNHLGLLLALTAATLGNADMKRLQMWTSNNTETANMLAGLEMFTQYQRFAYDHNGRITELPLAVELKRFIMEMYDDGTTPRRFASEVIIYSKASQHKYAATIDVNHPVKIDGWKIYQKDYRLTEFGEDCQISILELVKDPWLPVVYTGIIMMLAGALLVGGLRKK